MKSLSSVVAWGLVGVVCVLLLRGCNCRVTTGNKKSPRISHFKKLPQGMKIMLPSDRVATVIVDEETGLTNGRWGMQAVFREQTVKVTESVVLWNGKEVAKLAPEVKAVEVKIVAKQLKITVDRKTVLFETGF